MTALRRRVPFLFILGYAAFWTSMLLPGVDVKFMEAASTTPGWVCALYTPPMWPVNGTLALLPLAWWRWRRSGWRFWRVGGLLGSASAALAQAVVLVRPTAWDVETLRTGFFVWFGSAVLMHAAFATTPSPQARSTPEADD